MWNILKFKFCGNLVASDENNSDKFLFNAKAFKLSCWVFLFVCFMTGQKNVKRDNIFDSDDDLEVIKQRKEWLCSTTLPLPIGDTS